MKKVNINHYSVKLKTFQDLNSGYYLYNYLDSTETVQMPDSQNKLQDITVYNYLPIRISGKPTYTSCLYQAVRKYYTIEEESNLINSYNNYQLGNSIPEETLTAYQEYVAKVEELRTQVKKDFNISDTKIISMPSTAQLNTLATMLVNTVDLTNAQALSVKSIFPTWEDYIGKEVKANFKLQYNNKLFKVVKDHTVQKQYPPSIDTASLYTEITETQSGTKDDPIDYPSDGNMVIYKGKYYKEDGVLYECIRDSGQPLYTKLANMIGNYVQKIS